VIVVHDAHLGRDVALKQMLSTLPETAAATRTAESLPDSPASDAQRLQVDRFLREARIAGQLEHPNIIPIHEIGQRPDGTYYYTMKLVRGRTMAEALRQCRSTADRLGLLPHYVDLCQAIAYAHSRRVIHRDIKTDNVMLGEFGETLVLDWGIAKVQGAPDDSTEDGPLPDLEIGGNATRMGAVMGTPAYMSPEQALGDLEEIDERTDVWSLGAVLYEILTGAPPFGGEKASEIIPKVVSAPIPKAQEICPDVPPELSAICEHALQRDKRCRYSGAAALAQEILAYQAGARVRAYDYSSWELLRRFARKNRTPLGAAGLIMMLMLAAAVALLVSWRQELDAGRLAHYRMAQAYDEKADSLIQELRSLASPVFAAASLIHNPANPASPYHDPSFGRRFPDSGRLQVEAASKVYQATLDGRLELQQSMAAPGNVTRVAFSPDGSLLAVGDYSGTVSIREVLTQRLWRQTTDGAMVLGLRFSPDGRYLASSCSDRPARILDVGTGKTARILDDDGRFVRDLIFLDKAQILATAGDEGLVRLRNTRDWTVKRVLAGHAGGILCLAASPDGQTLASGDRDGVVRFWRIPDGQPLGSLNAHAGAVSGLAYRPDGRQLVTASWDQTIRLWEVPAGRLVRTIAGHRDIITGLALARDGDTIATLGLDKVVRLNRLSTGGHLSTLGAINTGVMNLAFSPATDVLAVPDEKETVSLWNLRRSGRSLHLEGHTGIIMDLAYSPDGRCIVTGGFDQAVRIWSTADGRLLHTLAGHTAPVWALAISPDASLLASSSRDGNIRLWDLPTGKLRSSRQLDALAAAQIAFSPDSRWLAADGEGKGVWLWDLRPGSPGRLLDSPADQGRGVAFLPDGRLLGACEDGMIRLWDTASGRLLREYPFRGPVFQVGVSPDGRQFATDTLNGLILIRTFAGAEVARLATGQQDRIKAAWFSPDGRHLVSGGRDRTILVWALDSRTVELVLKLEREARVARFSHDGRNLAIASGQTAVIYPLDFGLLQSIARTPERFLHRAEQASGYRLDGFTLVR